METNSRLTTNSLITDQLLTVKRCAAAPQTPHDITYNKTRKTTYKYINISNVILTTLLIYKY